jgi:hypothetical protein
MSNVNRSHFTRRELLAAGVAVAGGASIPAQGAAPAFPKLDPQSPQARALGYFEDAKSVDPKKNPTWKAGQDCANCLQVTGKPGDAWRGCNLFPQKLVAAKGWCRVWVKKS